LLGKEIRLHRIKLNWKESDLAERAGVARATVQKIEKGNPGCAIGLIFEAAVLVGIKLFDAEAATLRARLTQTEEKLTLLPKKMRHTTLPPDDDF
jgi:DNA-binding XRE family transcriptional regulator